MSPSGRLWPRSDLSVPASSWHDLEIAKSNEAFSDHWGFAPIAFEQFKGKHGDGDITADANATPTMVFGATAEVQITGGDLLQLNSQPVRVNGITRVVFGAGTKSGGQTLPAQTNRARLEQNGVDVTSQLVVP